MQGCFFFSNMQLFYKHSYFSDEPMLKIWPEDKSVSMLWKLSSGSGGRYSSLVFSMLLPFLSVLYFFLPTASKQPVLWHILFCALPYRSWHCKDANRIRKNEINLALRIAVLSVNSMMQNGIGGSWASPRLTGRAQWHRLAGTPRWGIKGMAKSCR